MTHVAIRETSAPGRPVFRSREPVWSVVSALQVDKDGEDAAVVLC